MPWYCDASARDDAPARRQDDRRGECGQRNMALIGRRGFVAGALGLGAAKGYPAGSAIAPETVSGVVLPGGRGQPLRRASRSGPPYCAWRLYDPSGAAIQDDRIGTRRNFCHASMIWFSTALEETRPGLGKIRSGNYPHRGSPHLADLVTSIFGYGPTRPVFHGTAAAWLHVLGDRRDHSVLRISSFHMPILWKFRLDHIGAVSPPDPGGTTTLCRPRPRGRQRS